MTKQELKALVRDAIEARGAELIAIAKEIWEHTPMIGKPSNQASANPPSPLIAPGPDVVK